MISTSSGEKIKSNLSIPIYIEGNLKWIICLDSTSDNVYSKIDILMGDYISEELPIICNLYELNSKTLYFSRYDELTGIMNRRYFDSQFEEYFLDEKIVEDEIAYVLFDLDGLKKINDAYGHLAGDIYIKRFVEFFSENIDNIKLFGRIGGDEFAAIFQDENEIELHKKINFIRNKFFNSMIEFEQQCFFGNFSYGISIFPRDGNTKSQIMKLADEKMYKDKNRIRR
jgi:diguanylate cyclase (GGDEF)-like protein